MIASRSDLHEYLAADLRMHGRSEWKPLHRISEPVIAFQRLLRRTEYWTNARPDLVGKVVAKLMRLRYLRAQQRLGLSVPLNVFGPGLSIAHFGLLVVNGDATVGRDCRIHQGVTIGAAGSGAPKIGDGVVFGPNSQVIGGVTVGNFARILPGAVVTADVPAQAVVGGVPATVKKVDDGPTAWVPAVVV